MEAGWRVHRVRWEEIPEKRERMGVGGGMNKFFTRRAQAKCWRAVMLAVCKLSPVCFGGYWYYWCR
jgi:hypothetical protein